MYTRVVAAMGLLFVACGYASVGNEVVGQPKKVVHQTPILCDDRTDLDLSLGVMRDGVGSMSTQDLWLTVPNESDAATLQGAVERGQLVKVRYDERRFTWCWEEHVVRSVEVLSR
jgi:hypothetical protein